MKKHIKNFEFKIKQIIIVIMIMSHVTYVYTYILKIFNKLYMYAYKSFNNTKFKNDYYVIDMLLLLLM